MLSFWVDKVTKKSPINPLNNRKYSLRFPPISAPVLETVQSQKAYAFSLPVLHASLLPGAFGISKNGRQRARQRQCTGHRRALDEDGALKRPRERKRRPESG